MNTTQKTPLILALFLSAIAMADNAPSSTGAAHINVGQPGIAGSDQSQAQANGTTGSATGDDVTAPKTKQEPLAKPTEAPPVRQKRSSDDITRLDSMVGGP